MFLQHFGLTEDAFSVTPNPKFLYFGREHREALSSLYFSIIENRGFAVMAAPAGMGKTTLLYYLRERMRDRADFALLLCSLDDKNDLLQGVMAALGVGTQNEGYFQNWRRLHSFLLERQAKDRKVVLVCDEAQGLSNQALENIRLLSNFETAQTKLLQIILAGQPGLAQKLKAPEMEQLAQRINVSCRIRPLDEREVQTYILHRLQVAGRSKRLFTEEAVATIARCSLGIPRNINTLCYNAMALAWALDRRLIDQDLVRTTVRDLPLADFSGVSASQRVSILESPPSRLPEPPLKPSQPAVRLNGSPIKTALASGNNQERVIVQSLSDQLSAMSQRLDKLFLVIERLSGVTQASSPREVHEVSVGRELKTGLAAPA